MSYFEKTIMFPFNTQKSLNHHYYIQFIICNSFSIRITSFSLIPYFSMKSSNHHQCCGTQEGSVCWFNADICGLIPFELGECVLFYGLYFVSVFISL